MLNQININIILIIVFLSVIFYIYNKKKYRDHVFSRFSEMLSIFENAKDLAYKKAFRDHILVHSSSGYRINREEMNDIQSKYIKLTFLFSGSKIIEDLEILYGDMDSICSVLANEFVQRVDQDELVITNKLSELSEDDIEGDIGG